MSRILMVDNDEASCQMVARALSGAHEVQVAQDGWTAFQMMTDDAPDAVVTDLSPPGLNGLGVLAVAHMADPMLPVVITSSEARLESAVEVMRLGACDFLLKPIDGDNVRAVVDRALETRRLREENIRLVRELRGANEVKAHLLGAVSHDFNNLLTVIKGYARLAQMKCADPPAVDESADRILRAVGFMEALCNDLRTYGRIAAGAVQIEPERFCLTESVETAVRNLDLEGADHRVVIQDILPHAWADPMLTAEVFFNLLGNAQKYSPPEAEIRVSARTIGDQVRCTVTDRGPGIPAEALAHVFEPFFRLERDRVSEVPGSGLGLTIVRFLVELQGGTVDVETSSSGTSFHFTLPATTPPHPA